MDNDNDDNISSASSNSDTNINNDNDNDILSTNNNKHKVTSTPLSTQINYTSSSLLSYLTFWWSTPAIALSNTSTPLQTSHVSSLSPSQQTKTHLPLLSSTYTSSLSSSYPLTYSLFKLHSIQIITLFLLDILLMFIDYFQIYINRILINHFISPSTSSSFISLPTAAVILILSKFIRTLLTNHLDFNSTMLSERITNEVNALIYTKLLKSTTTNHNITNDEGAIINLFEEDAEHIGFMFLMGPRIIIAPFKVVIAVVMLFRLFGKVFIYSCIALCVMLIGVYVLQRKYIRNYKELIVAIENNVKYIARVFHIVKPIKVNGYENEFIDKLKQSKQNEMNVYKHNQILSLLRTIINTNIHTIMILFTIIISQYKHNNINVINIHTAFQLINSLTRPLMIIPSWITNFISNSISINRIQTFLNTVMHSTTNNNTLKPFTSSSFTVNKGKFIAVIGETASGKSTLIKSLLLRNSSYNVSYLGQQPWVMNDTIKNNIVFYNKYDDTRYKQVIKLCQLEKDLQTMSKGDDTMLNMNGMNVSGGQKARIALARCVYDMNAEMFVMDDVFASIDGKVARRIFEDVLCGFLKGKTRVVVMKDITYLKEVDWVVVMERGEVMFEGKYEEFVSSRKGNEYSECGINYDSNEVNEVEMKLNTDSNSNVDNSGKKYKETNISTKQKIKWQMYKKYINLQGGYTPFIIIQLLILISQIIKLQHETTLSQLSSSSSQSSSHTLIKYIFISLTSITINTLREYIISHITITSIQSLFTQMITKLLHAPINLFHDIIPLGQIINHLTKDLKKIKTIIIVFTMLTLSSLSLFTSFYVNFKYNAHSLFLAPIIITICISITKSYMNASRSLQRLHRVSYSPILTILTETLKGVDVITACHKQNDFIMKMYNKLDDHYAVHIYIEGANKWYKIVLVSIANVFYSVVLMYLIVNKHFIPVTAISLILNYTSTLNEQLVNTMSHYSNVETAMIALERCDTYINIPQERKSVNTATPHVNGASWPSKGKIVFANYSTRYRHNLPLILRNVNITIHPNERIGIIGRTGSGKSTFVLALCRILESVEGGIYIDDVDISGVDLQLLRKSVTIVTQDPFVIEGTLRENVDPLGEYSDDEVVEVLNAFKLFCDVSSVNERLSVAVGEGGMNLSVGQRQLICFARAALKKSKVVVLDEATASIDVDTERIMKSNIDIYFKNSTVIIIAHHMEMVKGCNRVFIIDNGIIKEKDDVI